MSHQLRRAVLFLGLGGGFVLAGMGCELLVTFPASDIDAGPDGVAPEVGSDMGTDTTTHDSGPETSTDAPVDTGAKEAATEAAVDTGAKEAAVETGTKDVAMESCTAETLAMACGGGAQCGGMVTNNCATMVTCTPSVCSGTTAACDTTPSPAACVSCVANGHTVGATTDCSTCCSTSCSSGTTCCTPDSLATTCGAQCSGTKTNNCGQTVTCTSAVCTGGTPECDTTPSPNMCVECLSDADCTSMTPDIYCDLTENTCVACVPSGHDVGTTAECTTDCCPLGTGSCTSGTTCM
jgi:hypothetical protein